MGTSLSNPYVFRRAVAVLHHKEHPLSGGPGDLQVFWRTLFCTRMTVKEITSFWTPEDVRLLRLYYPDRLAAILLAAVRQIEAFIAVSRAVTPAGGGDGLLESLLGADATALTVGGLAGYMQGDAPPPGSGNGGGGPLDLTAVVNSLWIISVALPCCFENIDVLKETLSEDFYVASNGKEGVDVVSRRTHNFKRAQERRESPFAADFAYHFFFRGSTCTDADFITSGDDNDDDDSANSIFFGQVSALSQPLGAHLVELLVMLFLLPGFTITTVTAPTAAAAAKLRQSTPRERSHEPMDERKVLDSTIETDMRLLVNVDCAPSFFSHRFFSFLSTNNDDSTPPMTILSPINEEYRAIVLRTLLLSLSGFIFIPFSELASVNKNPNRDCLPCRRRRTAAMMIDTLFTGPKRFLSAVLCTLLLNVVRCYPKCPLQSDASFLAWARGSCLTASHVDVLGHALSILAMGIYSESNIYFSSSTSSNLDKNSLNVFFQVIKEVLTPSLQVGEEAMLKNCGSDNTDAFSSAYMQSLAEGLLTLLENPYIAAAAKNPTGAINSSPLTFHLFLWFLQQSTFFADTVARRSETLMALIYTLLVSSTASTSRFGEGQLVLLCFLFLARHPRFLKLLVKPLPSVNSGATAADAKKFLNALHAAMPMLPQTIVITDNVGYESPVEPRVGSDELCLSTYGNILVLALCYVISPSSPRSFRALHRSAVEVLHTLQVCFSFSSPMQQLSFSRHVLSPPVMLEIASALNYLCLFKVLRHGTEAQCACLQMIRVVVAIVQFSVFSFLQNNDGQLAYLTQSCLQQMGVELLPLFSALAVQKSVLKIFRLVYAVNKNTVNEKGEDDGDGDNVFWDSFSTEISLGTEGQTGKELMSFLSCNLYIPPSMFGFAKELASGREFKIFCRIMGAVCRRLFVRISDADGKLDSQRDETSEAAVRSGREKGAGVSVSHPARPHGVGAGLDAEGLLLRDVAGLFSGPRSQGCRGTTIVRKVVIDSSGPGGQWLLAQLWRQIHMFNLSPPVFDYRTALFVK